MSKPPKTNATDDGVVGSNYGGRDRRDPNADEPKVSRTIRFDAKGNPVLEVRTDVPRRRDGDETIDLLKCLDADALDLAVEDDHETPRRKRS